MVLTQEELLSSIKDVIGDSTEDKAIQLLENVSDTVKDLAAKAAPDGENWKQKYEENDKEWRQKYRDRFFSPEPDPDPAPAGTGAEPEQDSGEPELKTKYEELFTQS